MSKKIKQAAALSLAAFVSTGIVATSAATITRQATLAYYNIKVAIDGQYRTPTNEPFMIDSTVYVSLRDFGEMTGNTVGWDGASKTVTVTSNNEANDELLDEKNLEIAQLKAELNTLEAKLEQYEENGVDPSDDEDLVGDITSTAIRNILADIEDEFEEDHSVDWAFDLEYDAKDDQFDLDIYFDSYYDETQFNRISDTRLESFVEDIAQVIQDEFGGIEVIGHITDEDKDEELYSFEVSSTGRVKLKVVNSTQSLNNFEDYLNDEYTHLPALPLDPDDASNDIEVDIEDILVDEDDDFQEIVVEIYTDLTSSVADEWDSLNSTDRRTLEDWFQDIETEAEETFGSEYLFGYIYNTYDEVIVTFEYGDLTIEDFKN